MYSPKLTGDARNCPDRLTAVDYNPQIHAAIGSLESILRVNTMVRMKKPQKVYPP
jgi:hypothetical protein